MAGLGPKGQTAPYVIYDEVRQLAEIDFIVNDGTGEEQERSDLFVVLSAALCHAQHLKDTAGLAPYKDSDHYNEVEAEKIRLAVQRLRKDS